MRLSRRELLKGAGAATGALFLEMHGASALAKVARQPGVAILCGMDSYSFLRGDGRNLYNAGSHSIELLVPALKKHGFGTIHKLINPTKAQILQALAEKAQPGNRLLFYFLGHGSRDPYGDGTLLAADARDDDPNESYLRRDDLRRTLTAVIQDKKVFVTCFLDACNSWAVAYDLGSKSIPNRRYFPLAYEQYRLKDIRDKPRESAPDNRRSVLQQPCFFTAADSHESAYVAAIPGNEERMAGIFSYNLSRTLQEAAPQVLWENVYNKTLAACAAYSHEYNMPTQTPKITSAYRAVTLFEGKTENTVDLEHLYELNFPDLTALSITVKPVRQAINPVSIPVDEEFDIEITLRNGGYLVAVEKTPSNHYVLHFPMDGKIGTAKVSAQTVLLPADRQKAFFHDKPGPDTFKAFLYRDADSAEKLLKMLRNLVGGSGSEQETKDIKTGARANGSVDVISADLITASFRFDVRPKAGN